MLAEIGRPLDPSSLFMVDHLQDKVSTLSIAQNLCCHDTIGTQNYHIHGCGQIDVADVLKVTILLLSSPAIIKSSCN